MKWNHKWKLWTKYKSHLDNRMATVSSSVQFSFFPLCPALIQAQAGWTGMALQRLTTKTPRKDCPFRQNIEKKLALRATRECGEKSFLLPRPADLQQDKTRGKLSLEKGATERIPSSGKIMQKWNPCSLHLPSWSSLQAGPVPQKRVTDRGENLETISSHWAKERGPWKSESETPNST